MHSKTPLILTALFFLVAGSVLVESASGKDLVRPEKIRSMREVVFTQQRYDELAGLWKDYNDEFPSEDAYGNWMYAARYAGWSDYEKLLDKGLKKYPANPVLLYLAGSKNHGQHANVQGRQYLEKAVALDPGYLDPWFSLVIHYMDDRDEERTDLALRHLLEHEAVAEEVMDYSFNLLASLKKDAVLITNGDNDTYPGWILTRLLDHRPDVTIVNRSLLNTTWYPGYLIERGLPAFVTEAELESLRSVILAEIKAGKKQSHGGGPFGDALIEKIVTEAGNRGRPVYFSVTLSPSEVVDRHLERGRLLGLAALVTPTRTPLREDLAAVIDIWLADFRTAGLDGWRLRHAAAAAAGRQLVKNYAGVLARMVEVLAEQDVDQQSRLFFWYQEHVAAVIPQDLQEQMNRTWCAQVEAPAVQSWCRGRGYAR